MAAAYQLVGRYASLSKKLRLFALDYIDSGVLKARYLEEARPNLLNKHEWHDQTLKLWIEIIAAPRSNTGLPLSRVSRRREVVH
jgi:hypothetical protein